MQILYTSEIISLEHTTDGIEEGRKRSPEAPRTFAAGRYKAVFINKLSDASQEAAETQTWLEFALRCGYINRAIFETLNEKYEHIFAMLMTMERKVDTFCNEK